MKKFPILLTIVLICAYKTSTAPSSADFSRYLETGDPFNAFEALSVGADVNKRISNDYSVLLFALKKTL